MYVCIEYQLLLCKTCPRVFFRAHYQFYCVVRSSVSKPQTPPNQLVLSFRQTLVSIHWCPILQTNSHSYLLGVHRLSINVSTCISLNASPIYVCFHLRLWLMQECITHLRLCPPLPTQDFNDLSTTKLHRTLGSLLVGMYAVFASYVLITLGRYVCRLLVIYCVQECTLTFDRTVDISSLALFSQE